MKKIRYLKSYHTYKITTNTIFDALSYPNVSTTCNVVMKLDIKH